MKISIFSFAVLGFVSLISTEPCQETIGDGGESALEAPCSFQQFVSIKGLNTQQLVKDTDNFFRYSSLKCENSKDTGDGIDLTCFSDDSFYLMRKVLSYGTAQRTKIKFSLSKLDEITYNDTAIAIEGKLSEQLSYLKIKATKEAGQLEFTFETDVQEHNSLNFVDFANQRKDGLHAKLAAGGMPVPYNLPSPKFMGVFSAMIPENVPDDQSFELVIKYRGNGYVIFQRVSEAETFHVATYWRTSEGWNKPSMFFNHVGSNMDIPEAFSPLFEADQSAFSSADGDIVMINNAELRSVAEDFVSMSSPALILKGAHLYWHIEDPNGIKKLADNIPNVEEVPEPSDWFYDEPEKVAMKNKNKKEKKLKKKVTNNTKHRKMKAKPRSRRSNTSNTRAKKISNIQQGTTRSSEKDFSARDAKLAFSAQFTDDTNVITIKSPEFLEDESVNLLRTFMTDLTLPPDIPELNPVKMVFDRAEVLVAERKFRIYCNISQDFDLITNMMNGRGFTVLTETIVPEDGAAVTRQNWDISGFGTTEILQQIVDVRLKKRSMGGFRVRGKFEISNMTDLWNATGEVHYLSQELRQAYPHLTEFAMKNLKFKANFGQSKLIIKGDSLIFAVTKPVDLVQFQKRSGIADSSMELIDQSSIEIVMTNSSTDGVQYTVGIYAENINFQHIMKSMFRKNIEGYPWLKMFKLGITMGNHEVSSSNNGFESDFLKMKDIQPGIFFSGIILEPVETDCYSEKKDVVYKNSADALREAGFNPDGEDTVVAADDVGNGNEQINVNKTIDQTCMFLKDHTVIISNTGRLYGQVTANSYEFGTEELPENGFLHFLDHDKIQIKKPHFNFERVQVIDSEQGEELHLSINGVFKVFLRDNNFLRFDGKIVFDDTRGSLILNKTKMKEIEMPSANLGFEIDKFKTIHSPYEQQTFKNFYMTGTMYAGTDDESKLFFNRETEFVFNLLDIDQAVIFAGRKNFKNVEAQRKNTLLEAFDAYGLKDAKNHMILQSLQSEGITHFLYTSKEEGVTIDSHKYQFQKGVNFFGKAEFLGTRGCMVYMSFDKVTNTMHMEINMGIARITDEFILRASKNDKVNGGKIIVVANQVETTVKYQGFIKTLGIESEIEFNIEPSGQFVINFPNENTEDGQFKLFNEAISMMKIQQIDSITNLLDANPMLSIDLAPSHDIILAATKETLSRKFEEIDHFKNGDSFNQFTSEVDGDARTVRELMNTIDEQAQALIEQIDENNDALTSDCVEQCDGNKVDVYGYEFEGKFKGISNAHQVADVACIAECEIKKPVAASTNQDLANELSESKALNRKLIIRQQIMQKIIDNFYDYLYLINKKFKHNAKKASKQLNKLDETYMRENQNVQMTLVNAKFQKKIRELNVKAKCIQGFTVDYNFYNAPQNNLEDKKFCFNGEFEHFIARKLFRNNFEQKAWKKHLEHLQKSLNFEKILRREANKSIAFLKRAANPNLNKEMLLNLLDDVTQYIPSKLSGEEEEETESETGRKKMSAKKVKTSKTASKRDLGNSDTFREANKLYLGNKTITFPNLEKKFSKQFAKKAIYNLQSSKSKRAFMYSSPWAALSKLQLYRNNTLDASHLTDSRQGSSCQSGKSYMAVARSLSTHVNSFTKAKSQLEKIAKYLKTGESKLAGIYNKSLEYLSETLKRDATFWLQEYERGVKMYGTFLKNKLTDFDQHGIQRWQENTVQTIQHKFGVTPAQYLGNLNQNHMGNLTTHQPERNVDLNTVKKEIHQLFDGKKRSTLQEARNLHFVKNLDTVSRAFASSCHSNE